MTARNSPKCTQKMVPKKVAKLKKFENLQKKNYGKEK